MVIYIVQSNFFEYETAETRVVSAFRNIKDAEKFIAKVTSKYNTYEHQKINSDLVEEGYYDSFFEYQENFAKEMLDLDPAFKPYVLDADFEYASFYYDILAIELN